jgi:hypothetical protein
MRMRWLLLICSLYSSFLMADAQEVTDEVTAPGQALEIVGDAWKACGVLQQETANNTFTIFNGFFIDKNIFVTMINPEKNTPRIDCNKNAWVAVGKLPAQGELPKHLRCKRVLAQEPAHGIAVLEMDRNHDHFFELAEELKLKKLKDGFWMLGYAKNSKVYYSAKCGVTKVSAAEGFAKIGLEVPKLAWGLGKCASQEGMSGSAILVRENRKWAVTGIAFTMGADRDNIAFSRFSEAGKILAGEAE